ncbi:MAG: hypothetical protein JWM74_325, partial [Myxococcaceae bacterium]|nr:hypothetical protein [Myxococcaceae bacterium]
MDLVGVVREVVDWRVLSELVEVQHAAAECGGEGENAHPWNELGRCGREHAERDHHRHGVAELVTRSVPGEERERAERRE